jgi:hypothetical protein
MDVRRAYCSAVDHNVPVMLRAGAAQRSSVAQYDPSDLICLDYKVRCTGWCCPLFSVENDADAAPHRGPGSEAAGDAGRAVR